MIYSSGKLLAKRILAADGVPTPPAWQPGDEVGLPEWGGKWIVKSCWEHASIGIDDASVVAGDGVRREVARRAADGRSWFAEGFVDGREINIALLDGKESIQVLPAAEIRFEGYPEGKPRIVGYAAKWDPGSFEYGHSHRCFDFPPSEAHFLERAESVARRAWSSLGMEGYARVDLRVDVDGTPWVIDVNANPCLSPESGFVATAEESGLSYTDLVARIVASAVGTGRAARQVAEHLDPRGS